MNKILFKSTNNRYKVILEQLALQAMLNQCRNSHNLETGGVLIGHYNKNLDEAIVTQISHEPSDSSKSHTSFIRGVTGLLPLLQKLWSINKYYLGEWHFHPYSAPTPSNFDITAISEISSNHNYQCNVPILIILGDNPNNKYALNVIVKPINQPIVNLIRDII